MFVAPRPIEENKLLEGIMGAVEICEIFTAGAVTCSDVDAKVPVIGEEMSSDNYMPAKKVSADSCCWLGTLVATLDGRACIAFVSVSVSNSCSWTSPKAAVPYRPLPVFRVEKPPGDLSDPARLFRPACHCIL